MNFDDYDRELLQDALANVSFVFNYNYGDPRMRRELGRLETIIKKMKELLGES